MGRRGNAKRDPASTDAVVELSFPVYFSFPFFIRSFLRSDFLI